MTSTSDNSGAGTTDTPPLPSRGTRSRLPRAIAIASQLAISGILIAVLFRQSGADQLIDTFKTVSLPTLGIVGSILALQYIIGALRLRMIVSCLGGKLSWPFSVRVTFIGIFYSQTFVSFIGGDGMRIWQLARSGMSYRVAGHAVAADRILGFVSLVALILIGLPFSIAVTSGQVTSAIILLAVISTIACVVFFRMGRLPRWARRWIPASAEIEEQVSLCWRLICKHPETVPVFAIPHILNTLILYLFLSEFGANSEFLELCALFPAVILLSMLPISFAGWGLREGALIFILVGLEIESATILGASIAFGVSIFLASLPGALLPNTPSPASSDELDRPPE